MKFLSRNTAGLNQSFKLHQVIRQARQYDFSFLQETKLQRSQASIVRAKWRTNDIFMSCADTSRRGVLTLVNQRNDPSYLHTVDDPNGQYHLLVVRIRGENYMLCNIYGNPDEDRNAEATMLAISNHMDNIAQLFAIQHTLLAGDFNFVLQDSDTTSVTRKPRAEAVCNTIINVHDLFDVAALQSPHPRHTYFRHHHEHTSARLDRFYCSGSLLHDSSYRILPRVSDHAPIQFTTSITMVPRHWRFSDKLLNDPVFLQGLHNVMRDTISPYAADSTLPLKQLQSSINYEIHPSPTIFSSLVTKIRKYCMDETRKRSQESKQREEEVVANLIQARNDFHNANPPTDVHINNLEAAQQRLLISQSGRAQAAATTNHVNYAGSGERMSRYHFLRSGRGRPSREIPKLVIHAPEGTRALEGHEVPQHMFDKYAEIVQEDPVAGTMTIQEFLGPELFQSLRTCPEEHHSYLTSPVLPIEISTIVKELKPVSAPGPLGITNNLMKEIIPYMIHVLVNLGDRIFFDDQMPEIDPFFFHRLVVFILKPGKDCLDPDSYRGLSLLEGFFKIYSKTLASRIQRPMRHIQDPQQFGFTKNKGCLEASRTVLDTIQHARLNGLPLIIISTDFKKAFDSVSLNHIDACLEAYKFPEKFRTAFMRLVRHGTMTFQVNSSSSQDHELLAGTGQGDPKSSYAYNLAAAPLNHYLAKSPTVPRYEIDGVSCAPIFYADDELTLLQGDKIDQILDMLHKIEQYRRVSGLFLNLPKCEIMAINCSEIEVQRLILATNMRRVTTLKHLGLLINDEGLLSHADNIAPVQAAMEKIADSFTTVSSTPLGRSLYAKFLLSSRYLHKIQNFDFTTLQLEELRKSVLRLTWTRHRIGTDTSSSRVHIANNRVAQPLGFGGLSLPDPIIQTQALRLTWVRKFQALDPRLTWTMLLESQLRTHGRPSIAMHLLLGYHEWIETSLRLVALAPFWAKVFETIANLMKLSHKYDKYWTLIPIVGHESSSFDHPDISSLSYRNPGVRNLVEAGCVNIGQLFNVNEHGHINSGSMKNFEQLENEFGTVISPPIRNSIIGLVNEIKTQYRGSLSSHAPSSTTTIQSLTSARTTGCHEATRLLLRHQRDDWEWGDFPRSYSTYRRDNLITISANEFSKSFIRSRSNTLPPSVQWTSLQILLRSLWTNLKEQRTVRNLTSLNPVDPSCSNCRAHPENTAHLVFQCQLAQDIWNLITATFNECASTINDNYTPIILTGDNVLFNHPPTGAPETGKADIIDIIMLVKHVLYRLKFRDNLLTLPTLRLVTITVAIDLEKAILVRSNFNRGTLFMTMILDKLKTRAGF